jgi:hypothetical protein
LKTMTTLQAVTTQSTIDFGKQERYFICWATHLWHECVFWQAMATCPIPNNSNTRNCAASNLKSWGTWPQGFYG